MQSQQGVIMERTVEDIENAIIQLPQDQPVRFRAWYEKFDSDAWDDQIQQDAGIGRLDALAEVAIADHQAGKSKTSIAPFQKDRTLLVCSYWNSLSSLGGGCKRWPRLVLDRQSCEIRQAVQGVSRRQKW